MGWTILYRQYKTPYGEIDIVAAKDDILWFVEVKGTAKKSISFERISKQKQERIVQSAEYWLVEHQYVYENIEFVVCLRTSEGLDWIVHAFDAY